MQLLAEVISGSYNLGHVEPPQALAMAHQRRHRKLVVTTTAGKFLIKTYRRDPFVLDALRFQHRLADHLAKNNLPVAEIAVARDGKRIIEKDDWAIELQQFVEGEPMEVSGETLAVSAEALGKFHEVCRDFPRPERDVRMWRFSEVPRAHFAKLFERARQEGDEKRAIQHCNHIALFLRDASEALNLDSRSQFETGLIHGDWHGGNLIFRGERLAAIVDLEFAGDGCYLEDLSYAVSNLCIRTTNKIERLAKRTEIVLDHYQRHRTLSYVEEAALFYAIGMKHIATVSYQMETQGGVVAGYNAHSWLERLALQCDWLGERAKKARWRS
ncbi:MAG: phosphotransferase [FCB group bacterium]|jgi:Ser/Thr protein kinase RdoA (MazF antagonist)|nr:phosphotransferase [FCB group bacterium]